MLQTPERLRRRRRWTGVAALALIGAALGLGGVTSPVQAQDPSDLFGGYNLTGRANGVQVSYNVENVFPLPPPLLQISVPEALATGQSGPASTALGSAAFPGNVIGNLPAIVEQASPGNGAFIPPYPLATRADYPAGPAEDSQDIGTAASVVRATPEGSQAQSTLAASQVPGLITFGSVTTSASTSFEEGQVVARSRSEIGAISILFGLIRIEGIVTDMVATSNGETAAAEGSTTFGGVSILGLPATITADGLVVGEFEQPTGTGPLTPLTDNLGQLGQLGQALQPVADSLSTVLQQVLGGVGTVNDLLAASGITIQVMEPIVNIDGPEASITSNGVNITMNYDGSGDNPLAQLLALIPADQLPGEGLPGVPLNTSPQALVGLLKETHVTGLGLAYGTASVVASPAFSYVAPTPTRPTPAATGGGGSTGSPATAGRPGSPSFSTPTPALPVANAATPISETGAGVGGAAVGLLAVVLTLFSAPLWAVGSTKLADNALRPVTSTCPEGLDKPIDPGGT